MSNIKLGVEVASAHDLMPKDGQGSSSPYVELHLDHQKIRTTVKKNDLNPCWNEIFYFNISDPNNLSDLTLDAYVYNNVKGNISNPNSFMGKVHINGTSFLPYADAVVLNYPLKKQNIVSRVRGELDLKVFIVDIPSIESSNPIPPMETSSHGRNEETFYHLPNPNLQQPDMGIKPMNQLQGSQYAYEYNQNQNQNQNQSQNQPPGSSSQPFEYSIKETNPVLGDGHLNGGRVVNSDNRRASTYDVVEPTKFLFVRVVKAQNLTSMDVTGSLDPFVEVTVGNYIAITKHLSETSNQEWNMVFAFSKERMQASVLDIVVKDKDESVGTVRINLHDIPTRVPPVSPLASEWYRLEDKKGNQKKGELMLSVWIGTQADEAFPDAYLQDTAMRIAGSSISPMYTCSKVYHSPKLWYLRVYIIEVLDLVWAEKTSFPYVCVKAQINNQVSRTSRVEVRGASAFWSEDLMFVAAEPFEDHLILTIEMPLGPGKDEVLGEVSIPLNSIERRFDFRIVNSRWFNVHDPGDNETNEKGRKRDKFATRLHLRMFLDGMYHVFDESTRYSSDLRPTAQQLWEPSIGILELAIFDASALQPMKIRNGTGTVDAYCVAKYGHKWVRTRTVVDTLTPRFNEQYTWEVYDPSTVLTVGIFDNAQLENKNLKDAPIGMIRIRISSFERGRVYTYSYPLHILHPKAVKKMGELRLSIRFSSTSMMNMMRMYLKPLLPKMHYLTPLSVAQLEMLRHQAIGIVAVQLSKAEPPLGREIVEYMTDANAHLWSMIRSKAIFFRLMLLFDEVFTFTKWFGGVCLWKNWIVTVLVHLLFIMLVTFPELISPTVFIYMFVIGLRNYRFRAQYPPNMNTRPSYADVIHSYELNEEFDTFPTSRSSESRSAFGRIHLLIGDIVSQWERLQGLLTWQDPTATIISMVSCLIAAFVFFVTPLPMVVMLGGFYVMRHPRFRHRLPSALLNFFRRLPTRTDSML